MIDHEMEDAKARYYEFERRMRLGTGVIMNCLLADRLRQRAADGDINALRILASLAPTDVPARAKLALRDAQIRLMAQELFAAMPTTSRHAVAVILARAGHDLQRGRRLTSREPFGRLIDDERARLEAAVSGVLEVAKWPQLRQLEKILSLQCLGVETANASGVVSVNEETETHAAESQACRD